MPNGRCKVHGGKSTGPRTPEGLERSRRANWKHGHFSWEAKAERSRLRAAILALRNLCDAIRRFKSCHSDQHLAEISAASAKEIAKGSRNIAGTMVARDARHMHRSK
jgi:hypothetical protein